MPWPTPQEYNEAVQHPGLCFADADLRAGAPDVTPLGLPRPITGNFASVYRLRGSQDWAVRCFFRKYADMAERYGAISAHLATAQLPHTVGFQYLERGIRVGASWFPVLKMQWVEGTLLGDYVAAHRHDTEALRRITDRWLGMLTQLERRSIAHGDLQHGNVLVVGGDLKLVDYDGMFVPALAGRASHEIGHPNYQHPGRTGREFSARLDRFSGWVVYLTLLALQRSPALWDDLRAGDECLLFRRADFEAPHQSPALSRLRGDPALRPLADQVERVLALPLSRVPPVEPLEPRPRRASGTRAGAASSLPAWVAESMPPRPARRFAWPAQLPRLAALATAFAMLIALVRASLPPAEGGVLVATAEALVLWLSYAFDPAVVVRLRIRFRLCLEYLQLGLLRLRPHLASYRVRLADRSHAASMARLARRRGEARADHQRSLDLIDVVSGPRLEAVAAALASVRESRRATEETTRDVLMERAVERKLRTSHLLTGRVEGVALPARFRIYLSGIRTARDVGPRRIDVLQQLRPAEAAALLRWRVELEKGARQAASQRIPPHILRFLETEYGRRERRLARCRARDEMQADVLRRRAAAALELRLRRIDGRIGRRVARHERALGRRDEANAHLDHRRGILLERIDSLEQGLEPLHDLTFRRYLRTVLGLRPSAGT
jgi:hypothetical protein